MAMNSFRIVESFQIFKNQLVCLLIVANFKAIEPFTFDNRMKGFNACIILRKSFLRIGLASNLMPLSVLKDENWDLGVSYVQKYVSRVKRRV